MDEYRYVFNGNKFTFAKCGLNIEQNFMKAPRCPCCGQKSSLVLKSQNELQRFLAEVLADFECCHCAIFVIHSNGNVFYVLKNLDDDAYDYEGDLEDDEICIEGYEMKYPLGVPDYSAIGKVARDLGLHMYGLLVETGHGVYDVIES